MDQAPFDPPPLAVFFDLDDTLCDYASARNTRLQYIFHQALDSRGDGRVAIDLKQMIADSIQMHPHGADHFAELFVRYGIDDPDHAARAASWYRSNRFFGLELFSDARQVLQTVRNVTSQHSTVASKRVGIITNGPVEVQRAKVELLGISDLVDFVLISEEFGIAKPHPAIFRKALDLAGVQPEHSVFVGDSAEFDMAGARAAGLSSVWINRHEAVWTESNWSPDRQVRSLRALPPLLCAFAEIEEW